jgi:hypothetical protein
VNQGYKVLFGSYADELLGYKDAALRYEDVLEGYR